MQRERERGERPGIAGEAVNVVAQQTGTPTRPSLLLCGTVPPLADPYYPRDETGPGLSAGLRPGQVVVLTHGAHGTHGAATPAAQGGTGKTQLAVEFTHTLWNTKAVELLVWIAAASREAIVTGFAQAAAAVGAGAIDDTAEANADRFVAWLAHTRQPWALIIDDLSRASDLDGLWPSGASGQVVITTRLAGATLGHRDLVIVPVGGFSRREALGYLTARLAEFPDQRIEALDLGEDLEGLPLGLAQAAAVMAVREQGCRDYRAQLSDRRAHMAARSGTAADGVSPTILATWSLAAECAHELPPAGLAWPALALAAMLDGHGIPGAVLTSPTACGYITGHPSTAGGPDQNQVRRAISNLARVGLVTVDPATPVRTVRMHPSVQDAVRAFIPRAELGQVVLAAADALVETWPEGDGGAELDQAMRDCGAALRAIDPGMLWKPDAHPLLFRAGLSFDGSRLGDAAISYWQNMVSTSTRLLGPAHADAVTARDRLAIAYESAGRVADAIAVLASALTDRERNLGAEHPDTVVARGRLAHAYASADRPEAVLMYERTVADSDRQLGPGHLGTLPARAGLVAAYQAAGRTKDAIRSSQMLVTDAERLLGTSHPTTLAARAGLADAYQAAGQTKDAIEQFKRVLSVHEAVRGRDHPDAIAARAALASALRRAGKLKDAIILYEQVLADRERTAGPDHTDTIDTISARANLAFAYRTAGQLRDAIPMYERTLADQERLHGPDHRDTRTARANLAGAYQQAGRVGDAIPHFERVLADSERMQGPGDLETLTDRCNLAAALFAAGRLMEVLSVLQRALADCERYLGPDHPMTRTVRDNLKAVG
jgi:tetratricopeptide (TPR) repeat protein